MLYNTRYRGFADPLSGTVGSGDLGATSIPKIVNAKGPKVDAMDGVGVMRLRLFGAGLKV